ncbi:Methylated-DNA-(Protein)-cysteine S-methyltransferase DNA binding protein [Propionibacterium freudenreichii]|nr:Methylated-DNA-(Protein)-cysteine S-methyltransferase DNA binding protein [Propionibacterium freudenreichii]
MGLYAVNGSDATPMRATTLTEQNLLEPRHLEKWIVEHPDTLGDGVMVITNQFDKWATAAGEMAAERLDVLGLDTSGQLMVVELKRDGDKRVHLQAITYAALVSTFTQEQLGQVHATHLRRNGEPDATDSDGLERLKQHVDGDWDIDILKQPRIVLVAEKFPAQVLTSARWLTEVSGGALTVECHQVQLYELPGHGGLCADFRRIWPVADMADRFLLPRLDEVQETRAKMAERKRRSRTATVLAEAKAIPVGAALEFLFEQGVNADEARAVADWVAKDEQRGVVTWTGESGRSLRWAAEPGTTWSLSKLPAEMVMRATGKTPVSVAGGSAWAYNGEQLYAMADRILAEDGQ